jgi:hypothetical protein
MGGIPAQLSKTVDSSVADDASQEGIAKRTPLLTSRDTKSEAAWEEGPERDRTMKFFAPFLHIHSMIARPMPPKPPAKT